MVGLLAQRLKGVTVRTVGSEPRRGSLSNRVLIAENRCAAFFVSTVSSEILKPGSPLQRVHPVSVDRARKHADPHPYMDKAPDPFRWRELTRRMYNRSSDLQKGHTR